MEAIKIFQELREEAINLTPTTDRIMLDIERRLTKRRSFNLLADAAAIVIFTVGLGWFGTLAYRQALERSAFDVLFNVGQGLEWSGDYLVYVWESLGETLPWLALGLTVVSLTAWFYSLVYLNHNWRNHVYQN